MPPGPLGRFGQVLQTALVRPLSTGLGFMGRHASRALAVGVTLGLLVPSLAAMLRPWLDLLIFALTTATLMRIDWAAVRTTLGRPALLAILIGWSLIVSPLLVILVFAGFDALGIGLPPGLQAAVILMAAAPPITSAAVLATLLRLDAALALVVSVLSTLLVPLTLPLILPLVALHGLGVSIDLSAVQIFVRLAVIVGGAAAVSLTIRRLAGPARIDAAAPQISGAAVGLMLLFAIGIMDGVTAIALADPGTVALYTAVSFAANLALQAVGALLFWHLGPARALTIGILTGNCNMGLVWAGLGPTAPFEITLYFAVAQLPMYMLPALLTPIVRRLNR